MVHSTDPKADFFLGVGGLTTSVGSGYMAMSTGRKAIKELSEKNYGDALAYGSFCLVALGSSVIFARSASDKLGIPVAVPIISGAVVQVAASFFGYSVQVNDLMKFGESAISLVKILVS